MKVLKFGGSSVASPSRIRGILDILVSMSNKGDRYCVVFSAFGGDTDSLLTMARMAEQGSDDWLALFTKLQTRHIAAAAELTSGSSQEKLVARVASQHEALRNLLQGVALVKEASLRTLDYIQSFGERNSCMIIAAALQERGVAAEYLDARGVIKTNERFGAAVVDLPTTYRNITAHFSGRDAVQVVTGFVASTPDGLTTTLGRGGSDFTASLLAAALEAERIEIWTDVSGVMTADPRAVRQAFTIPQLTYSEAMEMSHFGAKVIYPPTLQPVTQAGIPLYIRNTFEPRFAGTLISHESVDGGPAVKGISSIGSVSLLTLEGPGLFGVVGTSGRLFGALAQCEINVILITQGSSEHNITFAVSPDQAATAKRCVEETFSYEIGAGRVRPIREESDCAVVAIIGEQMRTRPGIAGRMFSALGRNHINCVAIAQGSSELNISVVVPAVDESKALNVLHDAFFLSNERVVHLFLLGTGLIAQELLRQLHAQRDSLRQNQHLDVRVVGITNTRRMHFDAQGIDLSAWEQALTGSERSAELETFIAEAIELNLPNSIVVDCTASATVSEYYDRILAESISISTANKVAASGPYNRYLHLKSLARLNQARFAYETNVGAGLPVITTLSDLIISGDRIVQIDAVLSGSLSYIFNTYDGSKAFSEVVADAQQQGFTEPDPRVDLSGKDVARKLVILAREAGHALELDDVEVTGFLSQEALGADGVDAFFDQLRKQDDALLATRVKDAQQRESKLVMLGQLVDGKASVALTEVDDQHPFYSLNGSDNMIVLSTTRYAATPLVIRGPGAGASVTAAGVFAEIVSLGSLRSWE